MRNPCDRRALRRACWTAVAALAGILLAAGPASAQIYIAPDRSVVSLGPQRQVPTLNLQMPIQPLVVGNGRFVRLSMPVSISNPFTAGNPSTGFLKPFYMNDRIKGANLNRPPRATITAPWQAWW